MSGFTLSDLEKIVAERGRRADPASSWTAKLFCAGIDKAAKKLGEEAVETVIAAVRGDRDSLVSESADLLYHLSGRARDRRRAAVRCAGRIGAPDRRNPASPKRRHASTAREAAG